MSLKGNLKTVSLAGVLQLLCNEQKTGLLRVNNGEGDFQIIIIEGSIVYAIESRKEARLGELLVRDEIISEKMLAGRLREAKQNKQALGKVLVEQDIISKTTLHKYIYLQVEEILFNLFLGGKGEFEYHDRIFILKWLIVLKLNTMRLIIDALQRVDDLKKKL